MLHVVQSYVYGEPKKKTKFPFEEFYTYPSLYYSIGGSNAGMIVGWVRLFWSSDHRTPDFRV